MTPAAWCRLLAPILGVVERTGFYFTNTPGRLLGFQFLKPVHLEAKGRCKAKSPHRSKPPISGTCKKNTCRSFEGAWRWVRPTAQAPCNLYGSPCLLAAPWLRARVACGGSFAGWPARGPAAGLGSRQRPWRGVSFGTAAWGALA